MFPITVPLPRALIQELQSAELAAWEDHEAALHQGRQPSRVPLVYTVCERALGGRRAALVIENAAEAADVYYAVCAGTFQLLEQPTGRRQYKAACEIANQLRPIANTVDARMVALWPAPSGY